MNSDGWKIIHIPEKPTLPPEHQPTVKVYASVIKPKFANTIVRQLCKIAPMEDFRHVKRVRKKVIPGETQLTVILCLAPENNDHLNDMPSDVQKLVDPYELSPFITEVSKFAAVSKEGWEEQCKIWPTSFHPPTYNIDGIGGFSEEDTQSICKFMRVAIDLAVSGHQPLVNAAVIVDPSVRRIIASETDQLYPSSAPRDMTIPLNETGESIHCQSIDGITNASSDICLNSIREKLNGSLSAVTCLNPWQWSLQPDDDTEKCSEWHPLRHASIVAIESSSARDRYLFPNSSESFGPDHSQLSNAGSPAKKQKTSSHSPDVQNDSREETLGELSMERPYLCTGYDIFLLWEPCTMCAMALVHQRIKRIFYAFPNPTAGGLGSVHRLQGERSLNHHYAVFRVLLPGDAHNALDQSLKHIASES
ncbi:hypothetical protein AALP_AA2G145300 [Arabis alpina]|uniref:CMP/dCMP-type deaminase domain-containing protein n=1 Tax=Arabis alpina TaxID=50452 RepID=A0A087HHG1_ARAAL|nr:hypothetical protein AALP_AA2G145300 [Arabis alpina]